MPIPDTEILAMRASRRRTILTSLALATTAAWARPSLGAEPVPVREGVLGAPDAPVTIIEYSSLTCPHCAHFHNTTLGPLKERYIEPGKVKLILRDFPLDQVALKAAVIAHCAGEQRYPQFVGVMYANQERWARAADPVQALVQLAMTGGLAREQIEACLASQEMADAVLAMRLEGQNTYDISSTPTFIIDGKSYPGARSIEELAEILDPLLPGG
jgi:protein-disulfide isomerase